MEILQAKEVNIVITQHDGQMVLLIHEIATNQGDIYAGDCFIAQFLNHISDLLKQGYKLNMIIDQPQNQKIIL
jgi:hypothetical protein